MQRRTFLKLSTSGLAGLTLGTHIPGCASKTDDDGNGDQNPNPKEAKGVTLNTWLNINPNGKITIAVVKAEMGQGVSTVLPMLVAEELEADWKDVDFVLQCELPPYSSGGPMAFTAASTSVRNSFTMLREVGAAAREMLLQAAANRLSVPMAELTASGSVVSHATKGTLSYGELAADAALLEVPADPVLKDPADFTIIGEKYRRLDAPAMLRGQAVFGGDVDRPDMLIGAVRQSPVFGGKVANFDQLTIDGTEASQLVEIPSGVAVLAKSAWVAQKTVDGLDIEFEATEQQASLSDEKISTILQTALSEEGLAAATEGNPDGALTDADRVVTAVYEVPLLAHGTMEPMCCTAEVTETQCDIWVPTQSPSAVLTTAKKLTGLPETAIRLHPTFLGGGFGRRTETDFVEQAILASQAASKPVKVLWSRSEDVQHDFYRPAFIAEMKAGIDASGGITSWVAKSAGPAVLGDLFGSGLDPLSVAGFSDFPYNFKHKQIKNVRCDYGVPIGFWRSVGHSQNTFFVEGFLDELAAETGMDPLELRLGLLDEGSRHRTVLERVAEMANYGVPSVAGASHGIALAEGSGTVVAEVAEVSVEEGQKVVVHKVWCAVDCGRAINPNILAGQIEGGVVFGMTAALRGKINIENGRVVQSNFNNYPILGMAESPHVETAIVESGGAPGGIGELGVMPIAPALAGAVFGQTGTRIRTLPILDHIAATFP